MSYLLTGPPTTMTLIVVQYLAAQKKRLGEDQVISKPVGTGHQELGDGGCAASAHRLGNDVLAVAALKNPIVKTDIRF
jgi:hypothetical protein